MNVSVHSGRGHAILRCLIGVAIVALTSLLPSIAQAAAPANDEIGAAASIGSLPFTDTLDTIEASSAADDPDCSGNGPTVWYTFAPSSDIELELNTFSSTYDTTISVYTGSPGVLTQIACNDDAIGVLQSQLVFDATGGETYFIMAGAFNSGSGGNLTLTLRPAPPPPPAPEVRLSIDRRGFVDPDGLASISGSVTCNQPLVVSLSGSLTQTFAKRFTIQGSGSQAVFCTPPSVPWKLTAFAFNNGPFTPGRAQVTVDGSTCNSVTCAFDQKSADLTLRRSRMT
jgi:hypothetical protein